MVFVVVGCDPVLLFGVLCVVCCVVVCSCWLCIACGSLLVIRCLLIVVFVGCSLFVDRLMFVACWRVVVCCML